MSNAELWQGYPVNPLKGAVQLLNLKRVMRPKLRQITQPILVMQGRLDSTVHASAPQIIYDEVRSRREGAALDGELRTHFAFGRRAAAGIRDHGAVSGEGVAVVGRSVIGDRITAYGSRITDHGLQITAYG